MAKKAASRQTTEKTQAATPNDKQDQQTNETQREVVKGRKRQGWRYCEKCDHSTKGTRDNEQCGHCGKPYPERKKTGTPTSTKQKGGSYLDFLETRKQVKQFIKDHGGADKTNKLLNSINTIAEQVGGFSKLRASIDRTMED